MELKTTEGKLIVTADKKGYVNCPFCFQEHKHGKGGGNGYRLSHCTTSSIKDSYYVVFS